MDITQRGIITLLKSALLEQSLALPEGFSLETAFPQIRRHQIVTLVYDGAARCGISAQDPVMQRLFRGYCQSLMVSEGQLREADRIFAAFDENNIDYMPLKGCRLKRLYPKQELRMMGDADVLIRMEQYERIVPIMEALGFAQKDETDHELVWETGALHLELHKRIIPSYNRDYYSYFGDGWELAKNRDGCCYSMTAENEFLYLFAHFAKHYRDGGIGCRHVVDLWVYRRANSGMDEAYIQAELKKLQLLEFYRNIQKLLEVWFGDEPSDQKMDYITEFIFASGSWGEIESRVLSRAVRDAGRLGHSGKLVYLWQTAFPGVEILRQKYTILKKAPWMLPAVWLVRPFYKILFECKTLNRHKENMRVLTDESMKTRRRLLNYVGLDYHF